MKRAELARRTGYTGRQISRYAPSLPGASQTTGGQWVYDESDPRLTKWIKSARATNDRRTSMREAAAALPMPRARAERNLTQLLNRRPVSPKAAITPEHERVLRTRCRDPIAAEMWRKLIKKKLLSPNELMESIRKGTVTRIESLAASGQTRGLATFQGLAQQWEILGRKIERVLPEWNAKEAALALEHLDPILKFAEYLKIRFQISPPS